MSDTPNPQLFDARVVQFHLRSGNITQAQYKSWLESLPDDAEQGVETSTKFSSPFRDRSKANREG